MNKFILDACCGGRMFWFNKNHPNALYIDKRNEPAGFIKERPNFSISPDEVMDFRKMSFSDKMFKLVVFDPPHFKGLGERSWIAKKYGSLDKNTWRSDLQQGFAECWRVLEPFGVLVFKWSVEGGWKHNSRSIPLSEVLKLFPVQPLFGHTSGSKSNTTWCVFMKIPEGAQ